MGATFPFMKLPLEIRDKIYQYHLVFDDALTVRGMHPEDYKDQSEKGLFKLRTDYLDLDRYWSAGVYPVKSFRVRTSYGLGYIKDEYRNEHLCAMLEIDRRTRKEAMRVFYGLNTFHFSSMCTVLPFLSDRTPEALGFIKSIQLNFFQVKRGRLGRNTSAYSASEYWAQSIKEMASFTELQVEKLHLGLYDSSHANIRQEFFNADCLPRQWANALCQVFQGLDFLKISYQPSKPWKFREAGNDAQKAEIAMMRKMVEDVWGFLAPRMLKKLGIDSTCVTEFRHFFHIRIQSS